jgi:outer membrane protein assembly factor BamD (BamD/ComL family)
MDTPLLVRRAKRAGRWLRRLAALVLLGGGVAGCQGFGDPAPPSPNMIAGGSLTLASGTGPHLEWPDWELEDFDVFHLFSQAPPPAAAGGELVMQDGSLTPVQAAPPGSLAARMKRAHEEFDAKNYARAERIFHRVADNEKNPPKLVEEARFFEAEAEYMQDDWPKAAATYTDLMNKFNHTKYREQALQRMYDIANFWLQDTRDEMKEYDEVERGQRWFVVPRWVSFDRKRPTFDERGRALQLLEAVRFGDINGPLADKSLFLCGSVSFFEEDFKEADYFFTQLAEKHKDSQMVHDATRLAIISKHMSTGGADYDGRKVVEARILVQRCLNDPATKPEDRDYMMNQLVGITMQQAEKDFKMADFWQRTGHPAPAAFYYELVVRRYPGTPWAAEAKKRRDEIMRDHAAEVEAAQQPHNKMEKQLEQAPTPRPLPAELGPPR